jgi:hypothetical protein
MKHRQKAAADKAKGRELDREGTGKWPSTTLHESSTRRWIIRDEFMIVSNDLGGKVGRE